MRIDWMIGGLSIASGGLRNIFRAAHFLEQFGHDVGLYFFNTPFSLPQIREILRDHYYPFYGPVMRCDGTTYRQADVLFATHWSTVENTLKGRASVSELMYFVQDFEPAFAPMSADYILAENTYRENLYCICSGPWCVQILRDNFGATADYFDFPLDRSVYYPRTRLNEKTNIAFFAKPEMPRRCYPVGITMLRRLCELMPELEVNFFGSTEVDAGILDFPVRLHGLVPGIEGLAQLYSDADLGIVFSTTNPSLVPYEMMACGLPVVDLRRPGNELNYGGRFDVALLADPRPEEMALQVRDLLLNSEEREGRARRGLELVRRMPSEEEMVRSIERLIASRLGYIPAEDAIARAVAAPGIRN